MSTRIREWNLRSVGLLAVALTSCAGPLLANDVVDYATQIKPILRERCYACHGALKQESGLRLDTVVLALRGGDGGPAIQPGDAAASPLMQRVASMREDERMPPEGEPLKPEQLAALKAWISQGAKVLVDETPEKDPRDHWSFKVPVRPEIPRIAGTGPVDVTWTGNPIDAFLAAEHAAHGLKPQPPAEKSIWLRRVTLDLIGLPPTRAELAAFEADEAPDAYDRVVERLLNSPQYGERWGRHWMDIWRYSDWWGLGAEVRNSQKHIWHWRDWIIESLNQDKGYDQMVREMIAADELYPNDLDRLRASGFLARQYFKFNRTSWLDGTIEHTSKAFLGLTLNCAKCHSHKYDPLSQTEYYQFRAFFEPYQIRTDALPGEIDFERDGIPRAFDCNLDATTYVHIRGDDRNPDKNTVIEPTLPSSLSWEETKIAPVSLPAEAYLPGLRPFVIEAHLRAAEKRIVEARAGLEAARKSLVASEEAARVAVKAPEPGKPDVETAPTGSMPSVRDDFAQPNAERWEMRAGMWMYIDGKLVQSQVGANRGTLRLKQHPPENFEARLVYVPRGGEMWKSVGIHFDVTEQSEISAYLSSYAGGPKAQVAYKREAYAYPPEAAQPRSVDLDQRHELIVRVRGTLVNVSADGQHSIAYRLPIPRQSGALELITFDAKAEFLLFELRDLPADMKLVEPPAVATANGKPDSGPLPVEQAKLSVVIAEKVLLTAEAQPASIRARAAADQARSQAPAPDNLAQLVAEAVRAERMALAAKADEDASRAELESVRAASDKKADAEKKWRAAREAADQARKAVDLPGDSYVSLPGAYKTLESNLETEESRRKPFPKTSTGRRTVLASWLTDRRNPLPARVAVNHIWSRHFGRPLVPTVFDFGRKGTPPTHPELLDWLAVELVESGWSMKQIHRLIVTSQAYRMSSSSAGAAEVNRSADPDNRYYWRRPSQRMDAQMVRDSLLFLADELDLALGGPSIPVNDEKTRRRSLYFVHSHNEHQKFLSMFDDANVLECYRRSESIVPQQALALENSPQASQMAERIAARLADATASDDSFLETAFLALLHDRPSEAERGVILEALGKLTAAARRNQRPDPVLHARVSLILALINHNDFVTIR